MKFKELRIGDRFEFDRGGMPLAHGLARGPWMKTGPRTYRHDATLMACQVGTVTVQVVRLDPPHKAGSLVTWTDGLTGKGRSGTFNGTAPGANWAQSDPYVSVTTAGRVIHICLSALTFKSDGLPDAGPVGTATKSDPLGDVFFDIGGEG